MEFIKNIEIKNFKSIRHAKIEDCRRINVFIGYPNVGKSNILEAMSLISYLSSDNNLPYNKLCRYTNTIDIFNDGDKEKDAIVSTDDLEFSLKYIHANSSELEIFKKSAGIKTELVRKVKFSFNQTEFSNIKINMPGAHDLLLKKYQFTLNNAVEQGINPKTLNFPTGTNLFEVIRYNSSIRKEVGELFTDYNLKLVFDENNNLKIQKQLDPYTGFHIPFSQSADTLQRLIFYKVAIASNENAVLLFEEPEAHMFPPYISKFTADVIFDERQNQYFISSHSPFVLNDFMEELERDQFSIFAVGYKKETGETIVRKIADKELDEIYQYGIDLFFNLENYLMNEA